MVQEWAPVCMFNYKKSKTQNYKILNSYEENQKLLQTSSLN